MRVFLAGATGVIGRPLTSHLLAANHEVVAMTRSDRRAADLQHPGVTPVSCDVFDRENLRRCVKAAQPDIVIHQLSQRGVGTDRKPREQNNGVRVFIEE